MTEAEQISELKKELQEQQEQINLLKASSSGYMKNWERFLFYISLVMYGIPCAVLWYLMFIDWL